MNDWNKREELIFLLKSDVNLISGLKVIQTQEICYGEPPPKKWGGLAIQFYIDF